MGITPYIKTESFNLSLSSQKIDTAINHIPNDWKIMSLGEIGDVQSGGTPDTTNEEYWNGDINWCTPTDITAINESKYIGDTVVKITKEGLKNSSAKILPIGTVIVCTRATIGKAAISNKEISTNQGFKNIIPNKLINTDFLYYSILNSVKPLLRLGNGSTFLEISKSDFEKFCIPVPPFPEQIKISSILSTWDDGIQTTSQLIAQKELSKKWLMFHLLSGKIRLKGFEQERWKVKLLEDVLVPISRPVPKPNSLYTALGIRSHGKGTFLKYNCEPDNIQMDTLFVVRENDLIVNITFAWEGAIAIVKKEDEGALVSHRFPTFTFNPENGVKDYFRYLILQLKFKYLLDLISPGGAGRNRVLNKRDFLKLEVKIPGIREQNAIAKILLTADNELQLLKEKLELLKEQKKGLMQILLTGKKRTNINYGRTN